MAETDIIATAADEGLTEIVGKYRIAKMMGMVGGNFALFTKDEIAEDLKKQVAAGETEEEEAAETLSQFDNVVEFAADHKIKTWMKVPADVTEEQLKEAIESGEIGEVADGYFVIEEKEWKSVGGKYYYDTGEYREIFGEVKSPWDEITFGENGMIPFADGLMLLERI